MYFRGLTEIEYQTYMDWKRGHPCVSQVEFTFIPDEIDQCTKVRCLSCNEQMDITDFSCA